MTLSSVANHARVFTGNSAPVARASSQAQQAPVDGFVRNDNSTQPAPPAPQPPAPQPQPQPAPEPQPQPGPAPKPWTVMLWSACDNNLYRFMQQDIDEAERVGCTDQLNVIVQTDHAPKGGTAVRMALQTNDTPGVSSPVVMDKGDTDMADPHELADFIKWTKANYPAEHYMLIISDHGAGWQGSCHDQSKNDWMKLPSIEAGLKEAREATGSGIDVLGFDACLMAQAEVAHQLKDECSYLVGSQETEGGAGWQYNRVLSERMLSGQNSALQAAATSRLNFTPRDFAANVVSMAEGVQNDLATMTAIDTSKVPALTSAVDNFGKAILNSQVSNEAFSNAADSSQSFYEYHDLTDFADKVGASVRGKDEVVAQAADGVKQAVADAIVAEQHSTSYPDAHGISIELNGHHDKANLPASLLADGGRSIDFGKYADTKLAQETSWADAVNKFRG